MNERVEFMRESVKANKSHSVFKTFNYKLAPSKTLERENLLYQLSNVVIIILD